MGANQPSSDSQSRGGKRRTHPRIRLSSCLQRAALPATWPVAPGRWQALGEGSLMAQRWPASQTLSS